MKEKLSALAALEAAGSKLRQYWFCITPDKRYTFFHNKTNDSFVCFYLKNTQHRGVEQLVARQAHNLEVARSNRASATLIKMNLFYRSHELCEHDQLD